MYNKVKTVLGLIGMCVIFGIMGYAGYWLLN
jgi:hypothetical protein